MLHNVDLKLERGCKLALVGPSGGGKTTLCHLLPNFYKLDGEESGAILIDGIDIRDITLDPLRKNIGIVQQDVFLFVGTIKENIKWGKLDATDEEVTVTVKVNPVAMKMWALKYSRHIRVISPQSLVDEIKEDIKFAMKNYE